MEANFSSLWISVAALVGGLSMLVYGGDILVCGASRFALRHGMRPMLVGLTIVAFGTSMPEFFVSMTATLQDHADIMLGNVVGSNIANIALVLAIAILLRNIVVSLRTVALELSIVLAASLLLAAIAQWGYFSRLFGIIFTVSLIAYTYGVYTRDRKKKNAGTLDLPACEYTSHLKIFSMIFGGLVLLAIGSDFFIEGAVDLAGYFGIPELIVGLTVAAIGTSLPELASSLSAVRRKESDILVGNIVGSNMFNLLMVLGGTAIIQPFVISTDMLRRDIPIMIMFSAILVPFIYFFQGLKRWQGALLLMGYIAYIVILAQGM